MSPEHSGLAKASFWIALAGVSVPALAFAVLHVVASPGGDPFAAAISFFVAGQLLWLVFGIHVAALTLGISALLSDGRKLLAWIGVALAALPTAGFVLVIVSSGTDSEAWAERWKSSLDMTVAPSEAIPYLVRLTEDGIVFHAEESHDDLTGEVIVPVDRPIRLRLESSESYELQIPAFRIAREVAANRYQTVWLQATKVGDYEILIRRDTPGSEYEFAGFVRVVDR